jgi:diguanylate cyclase (GGDEF)-like protein/PAS domain S-box-containing protein
MPFTQNMPTFYKELLDRMSDGVYFVDRERQILYWNEGASRLTGYKAEEVVGRHCQDDLLCHVDSGGHRLCNDGCPLSACVGDGKARSADVFLRHKQGGRVPVNVRVQPIHGADGSIIGAVEIFNDNSAEHEARRKADAMERLAFLDPLTQLPNRRFLEMSVQTAMIESGAHGDPFGVLVIDLNNFKAINDTTGHAGGDRALQEVARTLVGALRTADTVGRWGGDEFLAIVRNVNEAVMQELAGRCVMLVEKTTVLTPEGEFGGLSISVGGAMMQAGESVEELIRRADERMYQAKRKLAEPGV